MEGKRLQLIIAEADLHIYRSCFTTKFYTQLKMAVEGKITLIQT